MDENRHCRLPTPHGHQQRLQNHVDGLAALHGPANNFAGIEINDHSQISKAFVGLDVSDVSNPNSVGRIDFKLPRQRVVDGN